MAESVLSFAAQLAKKIHVAITLIHVLEKDAPEKIHGQRHLTNFSEAEQYLQSIASMEIFKNLAVDIHVHESGVTDVSQSISDHSAELNQDLVVMCAHGNDKLHNFLFGSLAQQVISFGNTPVLLMHPSIASTTTYRFDNFLLPLDGNPEHERATRYSSILARMCEASIHLLIAVPHFGTLSGEVSAANRYLPGTTSKMMDMLVPDAQNYLQEVKLKIEESGVAVTTSISRGEPAVVITETAENIKADLIVLATHGKKGTQAFWEGSITPKVSRTSSIPLLLIPVK